MRSEPEIVHDGANLCGEGPLWDPADARLLWTDSERGEVFAYYPSQGRCELLSSGIPVAGLARNDDGRLVLAGGAGVHLWRSPGDSLPLVSRLEGDDLVFNDCLGDPQGRLYCGTYYWRGDTMVKTGCLYLLHHDGTLELMDEGFGISNGLGFSPDERTLYFADSAARTIYAYDVAPESGRLTRRRAFFRARDGEGLPDGLTVDSQGFVWTALWYGGAVVRLDPEGAVERRISLPALQVSSVAFGGEDLCDLYVTSASQYWPSPHSPPGINPAAFMGGPLYRVRVDAQGKPENTTRFRAGKEQKT
jgi:D-xylonolactonase